MSSNPWKDAIDEEAVTTWTLDNSLSPMEQLQAIINWHVMVATDPAVNGGYELVKKEVRSEDQQG